MENFEWSLAWVAGCRHENSQGIRRSGLKSPPCPGFIVISGRAPDPPCSSRGSLPRFRLPRGLCSSPCLESSSRSPRVIACVDVGLCSSVPSSGKPAPEQAALGPTHLPSHSHSRSSVFARVTMSLVSRLDCKLWDLQSKNLLCVFCRVLATGSVSGTR